jgi:hypothetical protein
MLWLPFPMLLVLVAAVVGVLVTVWLERKISAAVQQRVGPEYAGALGVLQPLADGLKLLVKEDIIPDRADSILFTLGPVLVVVPVILSWLIVPFGQNLLISDVGVGIFLWISLSSVQPIGLLMSGYASNNKYSLLGFWSRCGWSEKFLRQCNKGSGLSTPELSVFFSLLPMVSNCSSRKTSFRIGQTAFSSPLALCWWWCQSFCPG